MKEIVLNQNTFSHLSVYALIFANTVPLIGVLFFEWSLFAVIFLYWMENIVIGFFNLFRMYKVRGPINPAINTNQVKLTVLRSTGKLALMFFFFFHYGFFTLVHGIFVITLFGPFDMTLLMMLVGLSALILSHGISYLTNFIGNNEYKHVHEVMLFSQPYKRVTVLHLSIIAGGFLIAAFDTPVLALAFLIVFKTIIDIRAHKKEHKIFGNYQI